MGRGGPVSGFREGDGDGGAEAGGGRGHRPSDVQRGAVGLVAARNAVDDGLGLVRHENDLLALFSVDSEGHRVVVPWQQRTCGGQRAGGGGWATRAATTWAGRCTEMQGDAGTMQGGCGQRCIGRGGGTPPPSRAPSLCPATVSLTQSASLNGICNRQ